MRRGSGRDGFERPVSRYRSYSKDQLASHHSTTVRSRPDGPIHRIPRGPMLRPATCMAVRMIAFSRCQTTRFAGDNALDAANSGFHGRVGYDPALDITLEGWWSQTGSNRRPHACKARALPTELWPRKDAARGNAAHDEMVGLGGLEPPTSRLSSARSNQLSYKPLANSPARIHQHPDPVAWARP